MTKQRTKSTPGAKATSRAQKSKRAKILAGLHRSKGATIPELQKATGWQPHSVRAAISRLRKSGIAVDRMVANGKSRYVVVDEAGGAKA